MKIITLTLNPAFDMHCTVEGFAAYRENLAHIDAYEAGGKGVNISRALTEGGVENLCFAVLGEENGDDFARRLAADGMTVRTLTLPGRIRENITIHTEGAPETRISFPGFDAPEDLMEQVRGALEPDVEEGCFVTLTGSLPGGVSMDSVKQFLNWLREKGARVVIDSKSFTLADLIEVKPYLIKPNEEEISAYLGREITAFEEVQEAAQMLHKQGIEYVMISLGAKGALLCCDEGCLVAVPPSVRVLSTIGAGDSSIGGFLAAAVAAEDACGRLCHAVSYGSAACMTEGTRPPRAEDVAALLREICVKQR